MAPVRANEPVLTSFALAICVATAGCSGFSDPEGPGDTTPPQDGTTDPGTTDPGTTDPGTTDPATTGPGTTGPGTTDPFHSQGPVNPPTGSDVVGKRPVENHNVTATNVTIRSNYTIINHLDRSAFLYLGQRPLSIVREEPCLLLNLEIPTGSTLELHCRTHVMSDKLLIVGAEWFDSPGSAIPTGVARLETEWDENPTANFKVEILAGTAMLLSKDP